jgi:HSP20 family protein
MNNIMPIRRESTDLWDAATELDRLFDAPLGVLPRATALEGPWHPTMDIHDLPTEVVAEIELPGLKMEDLSLRIEDNHLLLEGVRRKNEEYKDEERLYTERVVGKFHRVVHLPCEVDVDKAEARLVDGVLTVRLPKTVRAGGRKIEITAS